MLETISKVTESVIFEKDYKTKITVILDAMLTCIPADAFSLYTYNHKEKSLNFSRIYNKTLGISQDLQDKPDWKPLPLFLEDGHGNTRLIATLCGLTGKVIQVSDVYSNKKFDFQGAKEFDKKTGYKTNSMLVLPLKYPEGNITGVLQLINKQSKEGFSPFSSEDRYLAMIFSSHIAIALHLARLELVEKLKKLKEEQEHHAPSPTPRPEAKVEPESTASDKLSAQSYLTEEGSHLIDELGEIAELQWSWDEELSRFIAQLKYTKTETFHALLLRYIKIIKTMFEFKDMVTSLDQIVAGIEQLDLDTENKKQYFLEMMEYLGDMLSQWHRTIFIDRNAKDIHYLDPNFIDLVGRFEKINSDDSGSLELF